MLMIGYVWAFFQTCSQIHKNLKRPLYTCVMCPILVPNHLALTMATGPTFKDELFLSANIMYMLAGTSSKRWRKKQESKFTTFQISSSYWILKMMISSDKFGEWHMPFESSRHLFVSAISFLLIIGWFHKFLLN